MSKERLEEIKKSFNFWVEEDDSIGLIPEDIEWLIEQAERVQELEKENNQIKEAYEDREEDLESMREMLGIDWEDMAIELPIERIQGDKINLLEERNKRYREAIEYVMSTKVNEHASVKNVVDDIKFILSEALEGEE